MHWGWVCRICREDTLTDRRPRSFSVWTLTSEAPDDPPKKMAEARGHLGLPQDAFTVMDIGETRAFAVGQ